MNAFKIRRSYFSLFILMTILALQACTGSTTSRLALEENNAQKEAAFQQIVNSGELMDQFLAEVMQNELAMHRIMEDSLFMQQLFSEPNMEYIMEHNPTFRNETMVEMMQKYGHDSIMEHGMGMMD